MGMNHDWGYSTRHFLALKKTYGTTADLKQLIDECHRRQIRVIIDAVFNHTSTDCPLEIIDHNYWVRHLRIDFIEIKFVILVL
jgi:1,4-alpha-glucan branching enzyme